MLKNKKEQTSTDTKNKARKRDERLHNFFILVEGLVVFMVIFLTIIVAANFDAFKNEVVYALKPSPESSPTLTPTPNVLPSIAIVTPSPEPIVEAAHIVIPKISVDASIQWDIPVDQTVDALNRGVAHLKGSARLGEVGNLFITGHSSDYSWKRNPYAAVFSLLPKLAVGDTLEIRENGKTYTYTVAQTRIVTPDQVEVTQPTTNSVLTLMTCYPIGTTQKRYIVHAVLTGSPEKPQPKTFQADLVLPEIKFR